MPPFVSRKRAASPLQESPVRDAKRQATTTARKPNLFDTLDQVSRSAQTLEDNKAYLQSKDTEDDSASSPLSDEESADFEDVLPTPTAQIAVSDDRDDGEEENVEEDVDHWEDALKSTPGVSKVQNQPNAAPLQDLQITIGAEDGSAFINYNEEIGKKGPSKIERQIRITTHCLHVQFLLWHNVIRNGWACDKEVQKILVGQLPQGIWKEVERWRKASGLDTLEEDKSSENNGLKKSKKKGPKATRSSNGTQGRDWNGAAEQLEKGVPNMVAGDPLVRLLKYLATYWKKRFRVTVPGLRKRGYKSIPVLEQEIKKYQKGSLPREIQGERIENIQEFRSMAKRCQGSRDAGAQLFTALLRGVGLEARLTVNLQPIGFGWAKNEDATDEKEKSSHDIAKLNDQRDQAFQLAGNSIEKEDNSKPLKPRNAKRKADSDSSSELSSVPPSDAGSAHELEPYKGKSQAVRIDRDLPFPHCWAEVRSPITNTYIPVDPLVLSTVAGTPDLFSSFEPRGAKADAAKQVIAYVVAFSTDGTAKDVTLRYLRRKVLPGKTKGVRMPPEKIPVYNRRGKVKRYEQYDWFKTVMSGYERRQKDRTAADDIEDSTDLRPAEPVQKNKPTTETLQGYKNSTEYVLERHLKREEALLPHAKPVRTFTSGKGDKLKTEPVFCRADVVQSKSVETWHKEGREIKEGEQPLKLVPMRAVTLMRKREIEEAERDTGEKVKQGLYARSQTRWIVPPPIVDGHIPRNAFGNIDIYVPTMVPQGAVHIRRKGTIKICKRLGIDYAEACIGFEFGKQRAVPIIHGVVIAAEYEKPLLDAWEAERIEIEKREESKRQQRILTTWKKFFKGLRILSRMQDEYGQDNKSHIPDEVNPLMSKNARKKTHQINSTQTNEEAINVSKFSDNVDQPGGFVRSNDDQQYTSNNSIYEVLGGGFITDDIIKDEDVRNTFTAPLTNGKSPVPLHNTCQNQDDSEMDLNSIDDLNIDDSVNIPKETMRRKKGRPRSQIVNDNNIKDGDKHLLSKKLKRGRKKSATTESASDLEPEKKPLYKPGKEKLQETKANGDTQKRPRRNAARKSQEAVRSHYFDNTSDDD